ncbi:Gfo/Idh/MocA family oxidoreductase [Paenalkalicoccus suaedae]|uniref:Gfo/Idh/MocA family oxidoreductase n=1 Tax=Paenalkalicoccus suaedae TaxID=2592382 RepID=A0A859FB91_9BACI|nr:Gfo/Idh/MocA family oxidoreductase [Paenalkalicoccus suaedae]QKS69814.1 Gfo/Idh/MocA family oxidoreductase [Paenalkalicoccus suaedae]
MMKVALLSRWHVHADDYQKQAEEHPEVEIVAVWDEDTTRGAVWAQELDVAFYEQLDDVLAQDEIDGVIVATPTTAHTDIIKRAAQAGKHIFTEKVLAETVGEAEEIVAEVTKANVSLVLSLPRLTESYFLSAQKILRDGRIGSLTTVRCRMAHDGSVPSETHANGWLPDSFYHLPDTGGGAFIDLGAHPIYLTNRLAGPAVSVQAHFQEFEQRGADDVAAAIVAYESGALGILETSFLSGGSPFQLELYGTKGTVMIEGTTVRLREGRGEWQDVTDQVQADPMPFEQWVALVESGVAPTITERDMLALTEINEAAKLSHKEGRRVNVVELR